MKGYNLTTTQYSKYYASLELPRGKRGAKANPDNIDRGTINRLIREEKELPGVLEILTIGGRNVLRVNKRCFEAYERIISPSGK